MPSHHSQGPEPGAVVGGRPQAMERNPPQPSATHMQCGSLRDDTPNASISIKSREGGSLTPCFLESWSTMTSPPCQGWGMQGRHPQHGTCSCVAQHCHRQEGSSGEGSSFAQGHLRFKPGMHTHPGWGSRWGQGPKGAAMGQRGQRQGPGLQSSPSHWA